MANVPKEITRGKKNIAAAAILFTVFLPIVIRIIFPNCNGYLSYSDYGSNFGTGFGRLYETFFTWDLQNNGSPGFISNTLSIFSIFLQSVFYKTVPFIADVFVIYVSVLFLFISFYLFSGLFLEEKWLRFLGGVAMVYSKFVLAFLTFGWPIFGIVGTSSAIMSSYWAIRYLRSGSRKDVFYAMLFSLGGFMLIQFFILSLVMVVAYAFFYNIGRNAFKRIIFFLLLCLIINFFWILPFVSAKILYNFNHYKIDVKQSADFFMNFNKYYQVFSFETLLPGGKNFVGFQYAGVPSFLHLGLFAIFFAYLFLEKNKKRKAFVSFCMLIFVTLALGGRSCIYAFLFKYMPLFFIFRDLSKFFPFIYLFVILGSLIVIERLCSASNKKWPIVLSASVVVSFSIISSWPLSSGDVNGMLKQSNLPDYYLNFIEKIRNIKMDSSIVVLPKPEWFSSFNWSGSAYQMQNPLKIIYLRNNIIYDEINDQNINVIQSEMMNGFADLPKKDANEYADLINAGYLVFQSDQEGTEDDPKDRKEFMNNSEGILLKMADDFSKVGDFGRIAVFKVKNFLPHFYTPERSGAVNRTLDELPKILGSDDWRTRSAVFFRSQNPGKDDVLNSLRENGDVSSDDLPTLEFRKINPTKYRVRIHAAQGRFPLVFSESFHDGWKAYLEKASKLDAASLSSDGYRILDGNSEDQADADELAEYVSQGWVTDLGDRKEKTIKHRKWEDGKEKKDYEEKYRIGFVSKDFQGTIQNDNLPGGSVFETWLRKPIAPADHLEANGYANAWLIDPEALCQGSGKCLLNPDGSYDMEIVVEFWPQRLFYIGLFISSAAIILGCIFYICCFGRKEKIA